MRLIRAPHGSRICPDRSAGAAWLRGSRVHRSTWNFTEPENVCSAKRTLMLNGSGSFWIESGLGVEISSKHTNYREEKNNRRRTKMCPEGFPKNKETSSVTDQINCLLAATSAVTVTESQLWAHQHTLISIPAGIFTAHSEHWHSPEWFVRCNNASRVEHGGHFACKPCVRDPHEKILEKKKAVMQVKWNWMCFFLFFPSSHKQKLKNSSVFEAVRFINTKTVEKPSSTILSKGFFKAVTWKIKMLLPKKVFTPSMSSKSSILTCIMVQPRGVVLVWRHAGSSDISPLLKTTLRCNNGGDDDDDSYHDDVGQMCWAQSVDPARAPHHRGAHVGDGHRQRACRETERRRQIRSVDVGEGRTHTRQGDECVWVGDGARAQDRKE